MREIVMPPIPEIPSFWAYIIPQRFLSTLYIWASRYAMSAIEADRAAAVAVLPATDAELLHLRRVAQLVTEAADERRSGDWKLFHLSFSEAAESAALAENARKHGGATP